MRKNNKIFILSLALSIIGMLSFIPAFGCAMAGSIEGIFLFCKASTAVFYILGLPSLLLAGNFITAFKKTPCVSTGMN